MADSFDKLKAGQHPIRRFLFRAVDARGRPQRGGVFARSKTEALELVQRLGLTAVAARPAFRLPFLSKLGGLSVRDRIFFARNVQLILRAGMGLNEGLRVLVRDLKPSSLKDFLFYLIIQIEQGQPIYAAFASFPHAFSPMEIEMIRIGELSGNLGKTFARWADDLNREKEIKSTISSAMIYPAIILSVSFGVVLLLVTFVMPKIADLVKQIGGNPPLATKIIVTVSLYIGAHLVWFLSGAALFVVSVIATILSSFGRHALLIFATRAPVIRDLSLAYALRNLCFVLGTLLDSGIALTDALELFSRSIFHPELRRITERVRERIIQGVDFGEAIVAEPFFPGTFSGVISIAARTGTLSEVLTILRDYYEEETKTRVKNMLALIEPLMLLGIGFVVGGIALSILVPIYQQISSQMGATGGQ